MIVYRALMSVKNKLTTYSLATEKLGFIDQIASLLSEFKRYGIPPEQIAALSEQAQTDALRSKLGDLALIYARV